MKDGMALVVSRIAKVLHYTNLGLALVVPCVVIIVYEPPKAGAFYVIFHVIIAWMKLVSYVAINEHFRCKPLEKSTDSESDSEKSDDGANASSATLVRYPDNVTLGDLYYFMAAPTLCYELNFPRWVASRRAAITRRPAARPTPEH